MALASVLMTCGTGGNMVLSGKKIREIDEIRDFTSSRASS